MVLPRRLTGTRRAVNGCEHPSPAIESLLLTTFLPDTLDDAARLAELQAYGVLNTPPEASFDDIVHLAARACATPVALVSLVDRDRQWFKARVNFPACETDLNRSVCRFVLDEPDLLQIPDLTADPRTAANPLVTGDPHIRFYAGAPLRTAFGHVLGSLCVIDHKPRPKGLSADQQDTLRRLARHVMDQLEMRQALLARDILLAEQRAIQRERAAIAATQAAIAQSDGNFDTVLSQVLAGAMQAVPAADGGTLELVDGDMLEYRVVAGIQRACRRWRPTT